jgi:hypothetical protein
MTGAGYESEVKIRIRIRRNRLGSDRIRMRNTARLSCPDCPTIYQHRYLPNLIFKKICKPRKKLYLELIYAFFGPTSLGSLPNSYSDRDYTHLGQNYPDSKKCCFKKGGGEGLVKSSKPSGNSDHPT